MSPPRLDDEMLIKFLQLYRQEVCLWDLNHGHYKDRGSRCLAIRRIIQEMNLEGFGETECKIKIKNVRSQYCKEIGKIRQSERSGGSVYVPSLFWFNIADEFLRDMVQIDEYAQRKRMMHEDLTYSVVQGGESDEDTKPAFFLTEEQVASPPKRRRLEPAGGAGEEGLTEFDLWAQSVALQLNRMDTQRALRLQFKLQCVVTKERMRHLLSPSTNPPNGTRELYSENEDDFDIDAF